MVSAFAFVGSVSRGEGSYELERLSPRPARLYCSAGSGAPRIRRTAVTGIRRDPPRSC